MRALIVSFVLAAGLATAPVALAQTAAPGAATTQPPRAERATRPPSPAQQAVRDRMRQCGAEWRAAKAAGTTGDQRWNDFRAACDRRLRARVG
jgi:hypothetical protein